MLRSSWRYHFGVKIANIPRGELVLESRIISLESLWNLWYLSRIFGIFPESLESFQNLWNLWNPIRIFGIFGILIESLESYQNLAKIPKSLESRVKKSSYSPLGGPSLKCLGKEFSIFFIGKLNENYNWYSSIFFIGTLNENYNWYSSIFFIGKLNENYNWYSLIFFIGKLNENYNWYSFPMKKIELYQL